jgi:hypothetical protein
VREWLSSLQSPAHPTLAASFDAHMDRPHLIAKMGSAAAPIGRRLRKLGFSNIADPEHFWVEDTLGPLREGQLDLRRSERQSPPSPRRTGARPRGWLGDGRLTAGGFDSVTGSSAEIVIALPWCRISSGAPSRSV